MERRIEDLYVGEDFRAKGEYVDGFLFFHCEVYKYDRATIRKIKKAIQETIQQAREMGYEKPVFSYVEKGPRCKLSRMVGGTLCNAFVEDGRIFEVYVWE